MVQFVNTPYRDYIKWYQGDDDYWECDKPCCKALWLLGSMLKRVLLVEEYSEMLLVEMH